MKNSVLVNSHGWTWPSADENSWNGQYEHRDLHHHTMKYVTDNSVMVQAGGNCGFILSTFVDYFDVIYTFEPDPINFYCLNQNIQQDNVIKLQACLSNDLDLLNVQQLVRPDRLHDTGGVHVNGTGSVPAIPIDALRLRSCGLIQLDVEGYELKALQGAQQTINRCKPVLCIEMCEKWLNRYNTNTADVLNFLQQCEYTKVDQYGVDSIFLHKSAI